MQSTSLATSGAAGTLQNFQGFRAISGTNDAEMHLPDGGDAAVSTRLSRAAASIYLERRRDSLASSIGFRRLLFWTPGDSRKLWYKSWKSIFCENVRFSSFWPDSAAKPVLAIIWNKNSFTGNWPTMPKVQCHFSHLHMNESLDACLR